MKVIIHAPCYMMSAAADIAARLIDSGEIDRSARIGVLQWPHKFSVQRNKSGVTVWHSLSNDPK